MGEEGELLGEVAHCVGLLADPTCPRILAVPRGAERPLHAAAEAVALGQGQHFPAPEHRVPGRCGRVVARWASDLRSGR